MEHITVQSKDHYHIRIYGTGHHIISKSSSPSPASPLVLLNLVFIFIIEFRVFRLVTITVTVIVVIVIVMFINISLEEEGQFSSCAPSGKRRPFTKTLPFSLFATLYVDYDLAKESDYGGSH